jgi:hypothetical protein
MRSVLDFGAVDELSFASERNRLPQNLPKMAADDIGPLVELLRLQASGTVVLPDWQSWLHLGELRPFGDALFSGSNRWRGAKPDDIGLLRVVPEQSEAGALIAFCHAAQLAAERAGFPVSIARQLAAFLEEMHSNICDHSDAADTGLVAYRARSDRIEFAVADSGRGVLKSLQTCPDYRALNDHGNALKLAISEGVSRFGPNCGHGFGFRPLFVGLANLCGALRFRSGDAALTIDGTNPINIPQRIAQRPALNGFFISVVCRGANGHI